MSRLTVEQYAMIREWAVTTPSPYALLLLAELRALRADEKAARELHVTYHNDTEKRVAALRAELDELSKRNDNLWDGACIAIEKTITAERRGFEACREAARQRLTEEAMAFLVEFGPSDAARIAMDCMRHADGVVAKLQPGTARTQGSGT